MAINSSKHISETPRGRLTGSNPVNGFQIISIREFNDNPNIPNSIRYNPHQLYFDLIIVFTHGFGMHNVDFIDYEYEPGSIFIIKKDQYHHWYPNPDKNGFLLFFSEGFESNFTEGYTSLVFSNRNLKLPKPNFTIGQLPGQQIYFDLLDLIQRGFNRSERQILPFLLTGFMVKLEEDYLNYYPSLRFSEKLMLFQEFQSLLQKDLKSSRNGRYYADGLNVNVSQLNLICKLISGQTLKQYIDNHIITRAKIALDNNAGTISEIAFDLGFPEVGNFSKYFKKHTGKKPKEFRKKPAPNLPH